MAETRTWPESPSPIRRAIPDTRRGAQATFGLFVVIALLLGVLLGKWLEVWLSDSPPPPPAATSVDVGFAQDMSVHHAQAVEMSAMALTNAVDPAVRNLAYDVLTTQQSQIGTMQGWLTLWDRPSVGSNAPTEWMLGMHKGSTVATASMPGMATTDELAELRRMTGPEFDIRYLQLLLRHHQGGIPMARYSEENATVSAVNTLAGQIASTQQAESTAIEQLLSMKGAAPLPMNGEHGG